MFGDFGFFLPGNVDRDTAARCAVRRRLDSAVTSGKVRSVGSGGAAWLGGLAGSGFLGGGVCVRRAE